MLVDANEVISVLARHVKVTTAEPERKTGRLHKRFYFRNSTKSYDCEMHVCSECGNEWSYDAETGVSDYNYCPNCGAKMEGIE